MTTETLKRIIDGLKARIQELQYLQTMNLTTGMTTSSLNTPSTNNNFKNNEMMDQTSSYLNNNNNNTMMMTKNMNNCCHNCDKFALEISSLKTEIILLKEENVMLRNELEKKELHNRQAGDYHDRISNDDCEVEPSSLDASMSTEDTDSDDEYRNKDISNVMESARLEYQEDRMKQSIDDTMEYYYDNINCDNNKNKNIITSDNNNNNDLLNITLSPQKPNSIRSTFQPSPFRVDPSLVSSRQSPSKATNTIPVQSNNSVSHNISPSRIQEVECRSEDLKNILKSDNNNCMIDNNIIHDMCAVSLSLLRNGNANMIPVPTVNVTNEQYDKQKNEPLEDLRIIISKNTERRNLMNNLSPKDVSHINSIETKENIDPPLSSSSANLQTIMPTLQPSMSIVIPTISDGNVCEKHGLTSCVLCEILGLVPPASASVPTSVPLSNPKLRKPSDLSVMTLPQRPLSSKYSNSNFSEQISNSTLIASNNNNKLPSLQLSPIIMLNSSETPLNRKSFNMPSPASHSFIPTVLSPIPGVLASHTTERGAKTDTEESILPAVSDTPVSEAKYCAEHNLLNCLLCQLRGSAVTPSTGVLNRSSPTVTPTGNNEACCNLSKSSHSDSINDVQASSSHRNNQLSSPKLSDHSTSAYMAILSKVLSKSPRSITITTKSNIMNTYSPSSMQSNRNQIPFRVDKINDDDGINAKSNKYYSQVRQSLESYGDFSSSTSIMTPLKGSPAQSSATRAYSISKIKDPIIDSTYDRGRNGPNKITNSVESHMNSGVVTGKNITWEDEKDMIPENDVLKSDLCQELSGNHVLLTHSGSLPNILSKEKKIEPDTPYKSSSSGTDSRKRSKRKEGRSHNKLGVPKLP